MESQPYPRPVALFRALVGAVLLCFPELLLRAAPHRDIDHPADVVARILGARHLAEAALIGRRRGRNWILVSFAIDAIHALTAFAFAASRPPPQAPRAHQRGHGDGVRRGRSVRGAGGGLSHTAGRGQLVGGSPLSSQERSWRRVIRPCSTSEESAAVTDGRREPISTAKSSWVNRSGISTPSLVTVP